jgi:hypothetical protein
LQYYFAICLNKKACSSVQALQCIILQFIAQLPENIIAQAIDCSPGATFYKKARGDWPSGHVRQDRDGRYSHGKMNQLTAYGSVEQPG